MTFTSPRPNRRRLTAGIALAAAAALALTACGGDDSADGGNGDGPRVLLAVSTLANPFFIDMRDGAVDAAEAAGVELSIVDAQDDSATQANQLADAVSQGFDAVVLNATDSDALTPPVNAMANADIPVITVDRLVNNAPAETYVASDNVELGRLAGEALMEAIGGEGEVAVLRGISGLPSSNERFQGFNEAIADYPDVEVVAAQSAEYDRARGLDVLSNILQGNPDIVGVFAENDEMALGGIQALGDAAGTSTYVVGIDGTDDARAAIDAGTMHATVAQQAYELGKVGIEQALRFLDGETLDEVTVVPVEVVTKD
ncbi:substrate-binding domain-containing protein [Georgenia satyanarayanai]|uniref:substrate-binding domain-containing protein n=1 Tax=Georgenia satyanarayanai TaxID=860221 RepID=UPI00203EAB8E|nr:substrate-binding domain-containing protein [Georgenia satyanarayanai]MCM3659774.1 substrate-binding domain-containing protein [Georgenia satyanarayanai]